MNILGRIGNMVVRDMTNYARKNTISMIKERFGVCVIFEVEAPKRRDVGGYIMEWINIHTPKKSNVLHLDAQLNDESSGYNIVVSSDIDTRKTIMLEPGTFMEYSPYMYEGPSHKGKRGNTEVWDEGGLVKAKLTIYGLNYGKYYADLRKHIHYKQKEANKNIKSRNVIRVIKSSSPNKTQLFEGRSEFTIQGSHINPLIDSISNWIDTEDLYNSLEIPYKLGVLLIGPPGTGKTSAVKVIASKFNRSIISIDADTLRSPKSIDDLLSTKARSFDSIILLEDIDRVIIEHNRSNTGIDIIGPLLNLLDGVGSPKGSIIIATANEVDELPPAILRPGRFDIVTQVPGLTENEVMEMVDRFDIKSNEITIDFIKNHPIGCYDENTGFYNPSKLQNILMPIKTQESIKGIK